MFVRGSCEVVGQLVYLASTREISFVGSLGILGDNVLNGRFDRVCSWCSMIRMEFSLAGQAN